jgi:hypothetical protein
VDTVGGAVETATHAVTNSATSATDAAGSAAQPVTQAATQASSGAQPARTVASASDAVASPAEAAGGAAAPGPQSAVDAATAAAPVAGPRQAVRDAVLSGPDGATAATGHTAAAADPLLASSPAPQGSGAASAAIDPALAAHVAPHDSVLNAVAEISPAVRVVASAAIVSSVVGASAAAGEKGGMRRLAFVNARLIPCLFKASVEQQLEAISSTLSRGGLGGAPANLDASSRVQRVLGEVSEGFRDAVDGRPDVVVDGDGGDGIKDSRLMTQVGMLIGLVYVGFLSLWFWVTRRRQDEGI